MLGDQFHYHVLDVAGPPMIHVTRNRVAEIVVFGLGQRFQTPLALNAGNEIMVNSSGGDEISVSKYSVADGDQKRIVSTKVDDVVRAVVELGGTIPTWCRHWQRPRTAARLTPVSRSMPCPRPAEPMTGLPRASKGKENKAETTTSKRHSAAVTPASPSPELFSKRAEDKSAAVEGGGQQVLTRNRPKDDDSEEKSHKKKGFFDRILGR